MTLIREEKMASRYERIVLAKFSLKDKKAIITGAARGLGREMALGLAEMGADIGIFEINIKRAGRVAEEIKELGRDAIVVKVDVTNKCEVDKGIEKVLEKFGTIDILINSAGDVNNIAAEDMSEEQWDRLMDINLKGTFLCCQAAGREMIKKKKGNIINISSLSALIVNRPQKQAHYNVSKAGVIMLTKSLAAEWAPYNIRVNTIAPGYMNTELLATVVEKDEDLANEWKYLTPMGRIGEPPEIKCVAVFLASEASAYVTGHVLVMDGGYTVW